ncbi:MAG: trypsin-like peptidase domain-containing protein [Anaerolineae bacterium]|nr:trypsin-like peptidase domain-containing protein [Anaerolineae bacterium]
MKKQFFLQLVLFLLLLPGLVACSSVTAPLQSILSNQAALPAVATAPSLDTSVTTAPALSKNETLAAIEGALENIYTQVNPSVVSIQVTQKEEAPAMPQFPGFPFFFEPQTPQGEQPGPQEFYSHGAGSGFVWDKQGHIVTNNHVVDGADKITVTFADETIASAEVVGTDPDSDLAVLKVDLPAAQLKPVVVGDSTQVKVGQLAVAIGNPFGLENTMTVGFVSALERLLPVSSSTEEAMSAQGPTYTIPDIIQTDAPINPGNSGGVLVNDQGQVIGVTAAIESPIRASAGVGFAIPSAIVQKVVPALIKDGHYQHSWLGLSGTSLNPELAQAMNLKADQHGALVIDVTPGSPADKAGLRGSDRQVKIEDQEVRVGGDVIVAIDGQPVKNFDDLVGYLVRATEVNQTVKLTVLRQGKEETVKATLAARPKANPETEQPEKVIAGGPRLGIEGVTLSPEIAEAMGLAADQQGVLVKSVQLNSPADQAHLNGSYKAATINGRQVAVGGDVITAVDNQPITSLEELQNYMQQTEPGQKLTLSILRDGKQVKVKVTLE